MTCSAIRGVSTGGIAEALPKIMDESLILARESMAGEHDAILLSMHILGPIRKVW
jgi:hypothetical protein